MVDLNKIAKKWQSKWEKAKIFEADSARGKKKFFVTFPYPYINLYPHIGHFYSIMRTEAFIRYKRMQGFNALFPQAWHCTGSPMTNAALRIKEGEQRQVKTMKDMGFKDEEIKKFEDEKYWIKVFSKGWEEDLRKVGLAIDWRRNFITTSLNPHYDKFVQWQFRILKQKGLVEKGKHPVIWCTKCNSPVGDHSRIEGEGETPQEYTLIKFKFDNSYIVAASLRPETVFGQTNMWIDPNIDYVKAKINDKEVWIMSKECANKLALQERTVEIVGKIKGRDMIGKYCRAPGVDRDIIILPSSFCDPKVGSGLVTSVPSDAPDDWIGLYDLQRSKEEYEKYGLNWEKIKAIKVIPIIRTKEFGDKAAVKICEDMGIKNQHEREKLEKARKIVYKAGYHTGIMNENCGEYKGMKVEEAKEKIKKLLLKTGQADVMYEPTAKVVCRCLTESVVKIVSDQWFIKYGDKEWKKIAHKCLDQMNLYPENVRTQFNYVIDWLNDWACTREFGLGTRLPWDEQWVIESLSDSTIYMAYYTIAHKIKEIPIDKIDDRFFDYVLLGKGDKKKIPVNSKTLDSLRAEFEYWYPMDFRNSGKDLIQNHLTFSIFIHTAVFPKKHWPRSFGCNGWVTIDGKKMSKSLGNVIPLREMVKQYSADGSRITILYGGEGLDDANWDSELARSMKTKVEQLLMFCKKNYNNGVEEKRAIDDWMESKLNEIVKQTTEAMEITMFRSAIQIGYFDLQRALKWYLRRAIKPNKKLMNKIIETQILLLTPFTPFVCEEAWEMIGEKQFISNAKWPMYDIKKIKPEVTIAEDIVRETIDDINSVLRLTKIDKPSKIMLFVAEPWKYELYKVLGRELGKSYDFKVLMSKAMKNDKIKKYGQDASKIIQKVIKSGKGVSDVLDYKLEQKVLVESKKFFEREFGCQVLIEEADKSKEPKAKQALPGKPAILVEK